VTPAENSHSAIQLLYSYNDVGEKRKKQFRLTSTPVQAQSMQLTQNR